MAATTAWLGKPRSRSWLDSVPVSVPGNRSGAGSRNRPTDPADSGNKPARAVSRILKMERPENDWFYGCLDEQTTKETYRDLVKVHHPDKGGDTATMQEINAACPLTSKLTGIPCHPREKSAWVRAAQPGKLADWVRRSLNATAGHVPEPHEEPPTEPLPSPSPQRKPAGE